MMLILSMKTPHLLGICTNAHDMVKTAAVMSAINVGVPAITDQ